MIEAKEATKSAFSYFQDLYQGKYSDLAVEEIELSSDEKHWHITLGFNLPDIRNMLVPMPSNRQYKLLKVSAQDGKVISMKIHKVG